MATEIDLKIVLNDNYDIIRTDLGFNVSNTLSYDAMDIILFDVFNTMAKKFQDKINHHNHNENLN
jgi:hypothetical protein